MGRLAEGESDLDLLTEQQPFFSFFLSFCWDTQESLGLAVQ